MGLEAAIETLVFLVSSIAVARYLGPAKLGYFSYINFFVSVVTRTSGSGLASVTRKYMSEFLALDQPGTARAVYNLAYRYQLLGAFAITALGLGAVALFGDPAFRLMSCILILAIVPGAMSGVLAQANSAFEDVSKNTLSAIGFLVAYGTIIALTIVFHWDLVGIASALLIGRMVEFVLRMVPLHRQLRRLPLDPLNEELTSRIRRFCIDAFGIQLLMVVVWDRSEMVFLRAFSTVEQIAFYSVSFGLASNLLALSRTFASGTGVSLMTEAVRDPKRVESIAGNASRYLLLMVFPVHLGAAAITSEAVRFAYGAKYLSAIPVLIVASLLAIPRGFLEIPEILLRAADRQKRLLLWMTITGVVNIALDVLLIPRYAAVGAAWANGLAQSFGIFALWHQSRRFYQFSFPVAVAVRLGLASTLMAGLAWFLGRSIPGLPGLVAAVGVAIPAYVVLVKVFNGLNASDRLRLAPIGRKLPGPFRSAYMAAIEFATPGAKESG